VRRASTYLLSVDSTLHEADELWALVVKASEQCSMQCRPRAHGAAPRSAAEPARGACARGWSSGAGAIVTSPLSVQQRACGAHQALGLRGQRGPGQVRVARLGGRQLQRVQQRERGAAGQVGRRAQRGRQALRQPPAAARCLSER